MRAEGRPPGGKDGTRCNSNRSVGGIPERLALPPGLRHFPRMATPTLSKTSLPGVLGEILIDVRASDRKTPGPAVLVLHGFKGFKDWGMFPPFGDRLARAGFAAVSFNVSGSGADDRGEFSFPDRFGHNTFSAEQDDLDRILEALDSGALDIHRPTSVGIVGHSRGGGMAILFAERRPRVGALATWAAISHVRRWAPDQAKAWRRDGRIDITNTRTGQVLPMFPDLLDDIGAHADSTLDIAAAAARLKTPWLLVHGSADEAVPVAEAERLDQLRPAGAGNERLILEGAGHTFGAVHPFGGMTPALEATVDATVRFMSRHLS